MSICVICGWSFHRHEGLQFRDTAVLAIRMTSLLSFLLLMAVAAECPPLPAHDNSERNLYRGYIGYLSFPSFFPHEPCETGETRVDVFASPGRGRRIAQLWRGKEQGCEPTVHAATNDSVSPCPRSDLPFGDHGYKDFAFIVLEEKGKWVKIALDQGAGWIAKESGSKSYSYEDLAFGGLSQIASGWNGFLFRTAGGRKWKPAVKTDRSVNVIDSRRVKGALWFKVQLLADSPCEAQDPAVAAVGWIPAYDANGDPLVDYATRGC